MHTQYTTEVSYDQCVKDLLHGNVHWINSFTELVIKEATNQLGFLWQLSEDTPLSQQYTMCQKTFATKICYSCGSTRMPTDNI